MTGRRVLSSRNARSEGEAEVSRTWGGGRLAPSPPLCVCYPNAEHSRKCVVSQAVPKLHTKSFDCKQAFIIILGYKLCSMITYTHSSSREKAAQESYVSHSILINLSFDLFSGRVLSPRHGQITTQKMAASESTPPTFVVDTDRARRFAFEKHEKEEEWTIEQLTPYFHLTQINACKIPVCLPSFPMAVTSCFIWSQQMETASLC